MTSNDTQVAMRLDGERWPWGCFALGEPPATLWFDTHQSWRASSSRMFSREVKAGDVFALQWEEGYGLGLVLSVDERDDDWLVAWEELVVAYRGDHGEPSPKLWLGENAVVVGPRAQDVP